MHSAKDNPAESVGVRANSRPLTFLCGQEKASPVWPFHPYRFVAPDRADAEPQDQAL
jgi:hypothetical protein